MNDEDDAAAVTAWLASAPTTGVPVGVHGHLVALACQHGTDSDVWARMFQPAPDAAILSLVRLTLLQGPRHVQAVYSM
jgi:hypothetical protein